MDIATTHKERFYDTLDEEKLRTHKKIGDYRETIRLYMRKMTCNNMGSLTELARQHSEESPGYVIQSWMRNHTPIWAELPTENTLENFTPFCKIGRAHV